MTKKIMPFLWFDDRIEEAVDFYVKTFKDASKGRVDHYPDGRLLTIAFRLHDQEFVALNGGPELRFNEAISFQIDCKDQAEVDYYWNALTADGGEESQCAWLKDKYGLFWQVVPEALPRLLGQPDRVAAGRVIQAMFKMQKIVVADLREGLGRRLASGLIPTSMTVLAARVDAWTRPSSSALSAGRLPDAVGGDAVVEKAMQHGLALDDALAIGLELPVAAGGDRGAAFDGDRGEGVVELDQQQVGHDEARAAADGGAREIPAGIEADRAAARGVVEARAGEGAARMLAEVDVLQQYPALLPFRVDEAPEGGAAVDPDAAFVAKLAGNLIGSAWPLLQRRGVDQPGRRPGFRCRNGRGEGGNSEENEDGETANGKHDEAPKQSGAH